MKRSFYFSMSLLIAAVVVCGFSQTIERGLIHPSIPKPAILYVHAAVFFGWVVLFAAQTALVTFGHVRLHRRLGLAAIAIGAAIPILGVATAITMARFNVASGAPRDDAGAFLIVPFNDMTFFCIAFGLAVRWRKRPEFHRRLMLLAACLPTTAAFGRLPFIPMDEIRDYVGVDLLILLGVACDLLTLGRVHLVYRWMVPILATAQVVTVTVFFHQPSAWMSFADWLIG